RRRRQRPRLPVTAGGGGAPGDVHRLEPPPAGHRGGGDAGVASGLVHPVREDRGGAEGSGRPAGVHREALRGFRRVSQEMAGEARRDGQGAISPRGGRGAPGRTPGAGVEVGYAATSRAFRSAARTVATDPALNARASASTPSEKMTPPSGMCDSMRNSSPFSSSPAASRTPDERLRNGSRTTKARRGASHASRSRGSRGAPPPRRRPRPAPARPAALFGTALTQPVEPAPVVTSTPLDDCSSACPRQLRP